MEKFKSIEEKIIFEKLTADKKITTSKNIINSDKDIYDDSFNINKISNYISEIIEYINILENTRENLAYRPIFSKRKLVGRLIIFLKKVLRRLLKFYIEPITFQQTEFNNAVTPTIGRLTEIQSELLKGISILQKENSNLKSQLFDKQCEIEKKVEEISNKNKLELELTEVKNQYLSLEGYLHARLDEVIKVQEIANSKIRHNEYKLDKLDELEFHIFKEKQFNFWDKKTFSQSGEDSISAYINMVLGRSLDQCTYLDLGANHAKDLSNTNLFYSYGARGVLVEANPALIPELKFYRNEDIILNKCIGTKSGDYVDFYILNGDGLSTPDLDSANSFISKNQELKIIDTVQVETISVNDIIEKYLGKAPVLMNIDIEGKDLEILESISFDKYRPLIIIAEVVEYNTTLVIESKNQSIIDFMKKNGYIEYAFTGINSIFIDKMQIEGDLI